MGMCLIEMHPSSAFQDEMRCANLRDLSSGIDGRLAVRSQYLTVSMSLSVMSVSI